MNRLGDKIKTKCSNGNINLIRIKYDADINNILNKKLLEKENDN